MHQISTETAAGLIAEAMRYGTGGQEGRVIRTSDGDLVACNQTILGAYPGHTVLQDDCSQDTWLGYDHDWAPNGIDRLPHDHVAAEVLRVIEGSHGSPGPAGSK